jgi:hypothetical protein
MADSDVDRLVRMFREFAVREFAGHSVRYELLSHAIAEAPGLGEPLLSAPPTQRRALLYFAATQFLLRGPARRHPLTRYLPTLGGTREPDGGLIPTFSAFVRDFGGDLAALCASRTTQTNEALRSAVLRPAFGQAAELLPGRGARRSGARQAPGGRPVALVELGTSAGLLLIPDRYGYCYGTERYGRSDAGPELTMNCELRGPLRPAYLDRTPEIAERVGLDLYPVDAADATATDWLRSCVWPEHVDRLARLDAALVEVADAAPRMVACDMVAGLATVLSTVDAVPLVFASNALSYLNDAARADLVRTLEQAGARRDLVLVLNEAASAGLRLFAADSPPPEPGLAIGTLTLVAWLGGRRTVTALGRTGPHGQWLHWEPVEYPYRPPGRAT